MENKQKHKRKCVCRSRQFCARSAWPNVGTVMPPDVSKPSAHPYREGPLLGEQLCFYAEVAQYLRAP